MSCPYPPPDHGPLTGYPSTSPMLAALWKILWDLICESTDPVALPTVVKQGVTAYHQRHGAWVPEITASNLVLGAAAAGALETVRLGARVAYRLPASLTGRGEAVL